MFANGFLKMSGKDMWQKVRFLLLKQRFTLKSWCQNAEKYFGKQHNQKRRKVWERSG